MSNRYAALFNNGKMPTKRRPILRFAILFAGGIADCTTGDQEALEFPQARSLLRADTHRLLAIDRPGRSPETASDS